MHIPHEQCPAHIHLPGHWLSLFHGWASSQPPEPHIDNQHDEEHGDGRQLGVRGAHVQVLGVLAVLLGQTGQVVGLGIKSCSRERGEELGLTEHSPNVTLSVQVSLGSVSCAPCPQGLSCWDRATRAGEGLVSPTAAAAPASWFRIQLIQGQAFPSGCSAHPDVPGDSTACQTVPDRASPRCRTSSMLATIILCTSCSSVLMEPRFLLARLSM